MYPGGKGSVFRHLINQMPPHKRYFELFLGDGAVMRNKRPADFNVGLDLDRAAVQAVASCIVGTGDAAASSVVTIGAADWYFSVGSVLDWRGFHFYKTDFIYLDPPYLMHTRSSQRPLYNFEFGTEEEHDELLGAIIDLDCMVMISGYWSELYADVLRDWRVISFEAMTRGGTMATEYVWMNYDEPVRLHDYSWLGDNFRERERIGRKAKRWVKGLKRLPILEQRAILAQMTAAGLVD